MKSLLSPETEPARVISPKSRNPKRLRRIETMMTRRNSNSEDYTDITEDGCQMTKSLLSPETEPARVISPRSRNPKRLRRIETMMTRRNSNSEDYAEITEDGCQMTKSLLSLE